MSQQINLYNPVFLSQRRYFSVTAMLQGLGLLLVVLIGVAIYANLEVVRLRHDAEASSRQLEEIRRELELVRARHAPRPADPALEAQLRKAQAELQALQEALNVLQNGQVGNTRGYATYFHAFARQILEGVWLTGLSIAGAGNDIELRGRALQPELVPAYIERLKRENAMQGKSFGTLEMKVPQGEKADMPATGRTVEFVEFRLH